MQKYNNIIAIDPDVTKSGVAWLKPATRQLEASCLTFADLIHYLQHAHKVAIDTHETVIVVVEAGWLRKSNWHLHTNDNKQVAAAKGRAAGRNHEVGRKIVEMCKDYRLQVIEHTPLRKCWKGTDGKITHKELSSFTGITGRTNQDMRDAALLAWHYAGLPIRVKP